MKKVLILVISSQEAPYGKMIETSFKTWDSINIDGVESVFYCGEPVKENTDKIIYFPIKESLHTMGEKTILAYEWALKNKQFDYIARVNSSTYVNKKELIKYIQTLPDNNCFAGLEVAASDVSDKWMWGPQFILSKDIIQLIVDNKEKWNHSVMDDNATSQLLNSFNIPYTQGKMASINKAGKEWTCLNYGGEVQSFNFSDFADIKKVDQHFFRVKQDGERYLDEYVMNELHKNLA